MKRVLVVSDNFTKGGLETRIAEQVRVYRELGVEAFLACENLTEGADAGFVQTRRVVLASQEARVVLAAAEELVRFGRECHIDAIDCQPLYGLVPAALAAAELGVPISYTIHGEYSLFPDDDPKAALTNLVLRNGVEKVFVVSQHLGARIYAQVLAGLDVQVARNGIVLEGLATRKKVAMQKASRATQQKQTAARQARWAFGSRLTHVKTEPLIAALPLLKRAGVEQLDVFGDGEAAERLRAEETATWPKLDLKGWTDDLQRELARGDYGGVIGMGRVAMEALVTGLPTVVLGYGGIEGAVEETTLPKYLAQNFTGWERRPDAEVLAELKRVQQNPERFEMSAAAREALDAEKLWREYWHEFERLERKPLDDQMMCAVKRLLEQQCATEETNARYYASLREVEKSRAWKLIEKLRRAQAKLKAR